MIEAKGGCHCRAVRFTAQLPDPPVPALDCNCSICRMTGFIHIMGGTGFHAGKGADVLTSYRFGTGRAEHLFCSKWGQELLPAALAPDILERECEQPR